MADKTYPMLPDKNWWTLRNRFKQSIPSTAITKEYVASVLNISDKAAANIYPALRSIGLIGEDGKVTDRAKHWRVDSEYSKICKEIINDVYPEELLHAVPDPVSDQVAAENWFMRRADVGQSAARGMARFFKLLMKANLEDGQEVSAPKEKSSRTILKSPSRISEKNKQSQIAEQPVVSPPVQTHSTNALQLHLDIQIHISPDASADQIDQIFSSMSRHLYKSES